MPEEKPDQKGAFRLPPGSVRASVVWISFGIVGYLAIAANNEIATGSITGILGMAGGLYFGKKE